MGTSATGGGGGNNLADNPMQARHEAGGYGRHPTTRVEQGSERSTPGEQDRQAQIGLGDRQEGQEQDKGNQNQERSGQVRAKPWTGQDKSRLRSQCMLRSFQHAAYKLHNVNQDIQVKSKCQGIPEGRVSRYIQKI